MAASKEVNTEKELRQARQLLDLFDQFDPKMQLNTAKVLLEIARADIEGDDISTIDIEKSVGMPSGTTVRNIYYWGAGHKQMSGGFELITVTMDPLDRRRRIMKLTSKGQSFVNKIKNVLKGG